MSTFLSDDNAGRRAKFSSSDPQIFNFYFITFLPSDVIKYNLHLTLESLYKKSYFSLSASCPSVVLQIHREYWYQLGWSDVQPLRNSERSKLAVLWQLEV